MISGNYALLHKNNFAGAIDCVIGKGDETPFLYACWVSNQPVWQAFLKLFEVARDHLQPVSDAGSITTDRWVWNGENPATASSSSGLDLLSQELETVRVQCNS